MLMCYTLFARHNLHTYSITDLSASIVTLVARELVFTQAVNSYLFTHQSLLMGSPHCTLASISTSILESVVHFIIPASHNFVGTMFHICCRHNEPITDREITNKFSTHREDCQLHHNRWELWSASTSCPTQSAIIVLNMQPEHSCPVFNSVGSFASQSIYQVFLHLISECQTFI